MNWTVVWISVGLAVVFKVWMIRKIRQWMTADRLARLAGGDTAHLAHLTGHLATLRADGVPSEARWAAVEAEAARLQKPGRLKAPPPT